MDNKDKVNDLCDRGYAIIPYNDDKSPMLYNYSNYFDGKKVYPKEKILKHIENRGKVGLLAGKQPNGKYIVIFDLENNKVKKGIGLSIEQVRKIFDLIMAYLNVNTATLTSDSINGGQHIVLEVVGMPEDKRENKIFDKFIGIEIIEQRSYNR
ncbi:MAG: hypothetical protein KatS3mg003_0787 [Candidatus Nitrosocaldaceae archaeon]|nr:MAG: hypothetical protein KatS3mg003_0787 [Candidatus Nitrosocaldaceae archaeon]